MILTDVDTRSLQGYNDTQRSKIVVSLATLYTALRDLDLIWIEKPLAPGHTRRQASLVIGDIKMSVFEHGKGSYWTAECDYQDKRTQWASQSANTYVECWIEASEWLLRVLSARAEDAADRLDPDAAPRKPPREDRDETSSFCIRLGVGGCILPTGHREKCQTK